MRYIVSYCNSACNRPASSIQSCWDLMWLLSCNEIHCVTVTQPITVPPPQSNPAETWCDCCPVMRYIVSYCNSACNRPASSIQSCWDLMWLLFCKWNEIHEVFFSIFAGHQSLFLRPLIPLFWISGDVCLGFQSQSGFLCATCVFRHLYATYSSGEICRPLNSQHGSWAISSLYLRTSIGGARVWDQACCFLTARDKTDALSSYASSGDRRCVTFALQQYNTVHLTNTCTYMAYSHL